MNSEDEVAIESEIMKHDSEDDLDHGPVLQTLRAERESKRREEEAKNRVEKAERKKTQDV